jgi:DNA-binding CsgD family transcriptional regulator
VLKAMCSGATRGEMAEQLAISPNTVRTHMQHILAKLDVHTSLAAVTLARRAGMS